MYGFGDDEQPYAETVDLLEDLVIEYISETVSKTFYMIHCEEVLLIMIIIILHQ